MYSYISLFYSWFISCCVPWVRITIFQSCVYYVHIAELAIKRTLRHAGSVGENKGGAFCSHWHAVWYMDAQFIYLMLPSFRCMSAEIRLWFVVYLDLVLFVFHLPVQVVFFYYFYYFGLAELPHVRFFLNLLINARVFYQKNLLLDKISVKATSSALDTGLQHDRWVSGFTVKENSYVAPELVLH